MALIGICCVVLLVLTTVIHYEVLRILTLSLPRLAVLARARPIVVIFATFFAHTVEIFLYALAFYVLARYSAAGTLGDPSTTPWAIYVYFSAETYTSVGYGDVIPHGGLRFLAGMEALNGLLLIGWSASYIFISMERFWGDDDNLNPIETQAGEKADARPSGRRRTGT